MKSLLFLGCIVAVAVAQRPTYAGLSPKGYPELASRFQDTAASSSNSAASSDTNIINRAGEDDSTTIRLPIDARGDADLVNTLNQWPRGNRPFWLLNAEHIERHRDPEGTRQRVNSNNVAQETESRSAFDFDLPRKSSVSSETRTIRPPAQRSSFLGPLRD